MHRKCVVQSGVLEGRREDGLNIFKNIPYARPPVDDLRWVAPQPVEPWSGVRDASEFGPSCTQISIPRSSIYYDPPAAQSEDCLSLNVWAPENAENLPVIVWIHGGSLRIGGAAQPFYDGASFARQDVVFVSINYRLGALGWMAHPDCRLNPPMAYQAITGFSIRSRRFTGFRTISPPLAATLIRSRSWGSPQARYRSAIS
jgi:para-nitrobenzyl esterase